MLRDPLRPLRALATVLLATALAAPVLAEDPITFEPPVPTELDVVIAVIHQSGTCRVWGGGLGVGTDSVTLSGSVPSDTPCTPELQASLETQHVAIGNLPARRYRVDAVDHSWPGVDLVSYLTVVPTPDTSGVRLDVDPRLPTSADAIALRVRLGQVGCLWAVALDRVDGNAIRLATLSLPVDPCPPLAPIDETFTLPPLAAGDYQVLLAATPIGSFHVAPPARELSLLSGRFAVTLGWSAEAGAPLSPAAAVQLTDQSGYFWFFAPGNLELSVKVLDGRAINGHFWVFASALTDRPFTLQVVDTANGCEHFVDPRCPTRTYSSPAGHGTNVLDFAAFPE
ncbi:MAG: hypothetical protein ACM3OB_00910 [Acidobacteriota bacterium]